MSGSLHEFLKLFKTPLGTGTCRTAVQLDITGTPENRTDMPGIYENGFVAEKKAVVEAGHRFVKGAAALIDAVYGMDCDTVRRSRLDIEDFADRKEQILIGQMQVQPDVGGGNRAFLNDIFQTVKYLEGILRIILDQKIKRFYLVAEGGHRHFGMGGRKNDERSRVVFSDFGGKFDTIHVRAKLNIKKIDCGLSFGGESGKKIVRGSSPAHDFHIVALNENIFFYC